MKTLTKEIIEQWITVLRSGAYRQGTRQLSDGESFCCLGVLCDITDVPYTVVEEEGRTPTTRMYDFGDGYEDCAMIEGQMYYDLVKLINGHTPGSLSQLNDDGKTFEEIADIIEQMVANEFGVKA